jgi:hypothetical protein
MVMLLKVVGFEGEHFSALDYHLADSVPALRNCVDNHSSH